MHKALLPELSNPEAAAYFTRLIEESLKTRFTQFNFFLHNLAQLKFTAEDNGGSLLSFVPKTYRLVHFSIFHTVFTLILLIVFFVHQFYY